MFTGKNEKVIAEIQDNVKTRDKSSYKSGIEMFERSWKDCVALDLQMNFFN